MAQQGLARLRSDALPTTSVGVGFASRNNGILVEEFGNGAFHKTVLTLKNVPITVGNTTGVSFGGVEIYAFPQGRLIVLGSVLKDISIGLDNPGNVTPIDSADGGDISLGTTVPSDGTLSGTDVDLCPSTSIDPLSDGISNDFATLSAAATAFAGQATPVKCYLNMLIDDADVGNGAEDVLEVSGTVILTWVNVSEIG